MLSAAIQMLNGCRSSDICHGIDLECVANGLRVSKVLSGVTLRD